MKKKALAILALCISLFAAVAPVGCSGSGGATGSSSTTRPNGRPTLSGPRMTPSSTTARLGATPPIHTRAA